MTISGSKGSIKSIVIAIGGGTMPDDALQEIFEYLSEKTDPRVVVMTVATEEADEASTRYNSMFRRKNVKHVEMVDVEEREHSFVEASAEKIRRADLIFFTGGDQLNVTALLGGSPLDKVVHERLDTGVMIAGTSAGAAMMSSSMIISGRSDSPPSVGAVEIAPGMNLVEGVLIDTHFSQRGRHGRLLAAIAHYPQVLGVGIDENTAAVIQDGKLKVTGEGVVTIFDASDMKYSDLVEKQRGETVAMFQVKIHVLPSEYRFDLKSREPIAAMRHKKGAASV